TLESAHGSVHGTRRTFIGPTSGEAFAETSQSSFFQLEELRSLIHESSTTCWRHRDGEYSRDDRSLRESGDDAQTGDSRLGGGARGDVRSGGEGAGIEEATLSRAHPMRTVRRPVAPPGRTGGRTGR